MNNLGKYTQIAFEEKEIYDEEFVNFIEEYFEVSVCNYTDDGLEQYTAYDTVNFDEESFIKAVKEAEIKLPEYKIEIMDNKDWLKDNVIEFAPIEVDDFLIYGIHEKKEPETNKIPIKIYAATAFGSEHQTTKGCLQAISKLNELKAKTEKVLDVGCGSGILSIAAAKMWSSKVFAVDIDEEAVLVTRQNATDNNVKIEAEISNGYSSSIVKDNAPYDIIMANILARPLIEMAEDLSKCLKKGGYCILSGFVANQVDWVIESHEKFGLKTVEIFEIDNWRAALMEK